LTSTSVHAILITILVLSGGTLNFSKQQLETMTEILSVFLLVYSAMFGLTVGLFAIYMNNLISRNVTHNERLRAKWNQNNQA
jgi:uncharacterized membrane protein YczE